MRQLLNILLLRNVMCLRRLYMTLFVLSGHSIPALAKDYFDPSFLGAEENQVDLSQFETAGSTPEGIYLVDIYMNQVQVASREVRFQKDEQGRVIPFITVKELEEMGVAVSQISALKSRAEDASVGYLPDSIPAARAELDMAHLRLNISVPQAEMNARPGGYVDPKLWDEGITAGIFNYTLNGSHSWITSGDGQPGGGMQSAFGNITGGFNTGAWRLRSTMTYANLSVSSGGVSNSSQDTQWNNTYLQRDIRRLRGELTLGEGNTGGDIFDSIPFCGVQLVSDNDMLPSGQRGFAPVVSGIANANATVTVTQNGSMIYQTSVAPGPFRIADMYQATTGGDLRVTVTESDGTTHVSTLAYSALPVMQRPGGVKYEVTTGHYHHGGAGNTNVRTPAFFLGTLVYGLPYDITLYGGVIGSDDYQSAAVGTGISMGILGAASVDASQASTSLPGKRTEDKGAAWRVRYSKSMLSSGTTLDITSYRYASNHYYNFTDFSLYGYQQDTYSPPWENERKRSSWQTTISQTLGELGSLYLRDSRDKYWNSGRVVNNANIGFSSSLYGVGYSINYSVDHASGSRGQNNWSGNRQLALNFSVPLNLFSQSGLVKGMSANYSLTHDNTGRVSQQAGLSGMMLDNKASWTATQNRDNRGNSNVGNLSVNYNGDSGSVGMGYGYDSISRNVNASLSGGV
ncbi:fimbria/pilus outer membrane usher protein, partial [Enterobacteriaceae bacterium LUAb1]